jgi:hypothetical protein
MTRLDPLANMDWRTAGTVCIDGATIALGDPEALLSWRDAGGARELSIEHRVGLVRSNLAYFITMDDLDCPVETCFAGGVVVGIRVEIVNDIADLSGAWMEVGEVFFNRPCCAVLDPTTGLTEPIIELLRQPPPEDTDLVYETGVVSGAVLKVPVGRYCVEAYSAEGEVLGVRLRLVSEGA